MKPEQTIPRLLQLYPVPNFSTWLARAFNSNQFCERELAHKRAIQQARLKRDDLRVEVFEYLYAGYFQLPKLFCGSCGDSLRERRGQKLFNTLAEEHRNELALLLLMHIAPDDHYKSLTFAINSAKPRAMIQMLQRSGINIDALNAQGYTLLSSLACKGNSEKVDLLLSCGADVNRGYSVLPAIYQAKTPNGPKMISLLLAHGAAINASDGDIDVDEFNQVIEGSIFQYAILSGDHVALRMFLQNALFEPTKTEITARQKRVLTTLCLFKRFKLARDVQFLLLSRMPQDVCTQNHGAWLLDKGIPLEQLVPHCRFSWLKQMYQKSEQAQRSQFFEQLVPLIVQHRMSNVSELLSSRWLLDHYSVDLFVHRLKRMDIKLEVRTVLDPAQVEQHRAGIEQNIRNILL